MLKTEWLDDGLEIQVIGKPRADNGSEPVSIVTVIQYADGREKRFSVSLESSHEVMEESSSVDIKQKEEKKNANINSYKRWQTRMSTWDLRWLPTEWNKHPWNKKAKQLLETLQDDAMGRDWEGVPTLWREMLKPFAPHVLNLMRWGLQNLEEYQDQNLSHRGWKCRNDMVQLVENMTWLWSPVETMEFLLGIGMEEITGQEAPDPTPEEFNKVKRIEVGASWMLATLEEQIRFREPEIIYW